MGYLHSLMRDLRLHQVQLGDLTLVGIADGGTETCLMVPELHVMFDVGMCPRAALTYDRILVSHAHADHLGGLPYLASQRGMISRGAPKVHLPAVALEPMQRIIQAWSELEGFAIKIDLQGQEHGDRVDLGKGREALALRSSHRVPSLAWVVFRTVKKLKPDFFGKSGTELAQLRKDGVEISAAHTQPILCVSGDTRVELFDREETVRQSHVLVYEVTSWDERSDVARTRHWGHTHIDELATRAEQFSGDTLVLVHRSARHSLSEAEEILKNKFPREVFERTVIFP